jgi:hypothetical protein
MNSTRIACICFVVAAVAMPAAAQNAQRGMVRRGCRRSDVRVSPAIGIRFAADYIRVSGDGDDLNAYRVAVGEVFRR